MTCSRTPLTPSVSAGPVFSSYALFHGLAVFVDTYSNDDATDVSAGSRLRMLPARRARCADRCPEVKGHGA